MKNEIKDPLSIWIIVFLLFCPTFKNFAIAGVFPPPFRAITADQHVLLHPEDVKYEQILSSFSFADCPVTGKIPYNSWPKKYVLAIPEGRCWIANLLNPAVITQDNFVLIDASFEAGCLKPEDISIFQTPFLVPPILIDSTVAVIASHGSWNYYHWMIDVLPKFGLIENSNIKPDYYYLYCSESAFEKETLSILGIEDRRIICADKHQHIQAKTLIVPSMLSLPKTKHFVDLAGPLWSFEFLRKKFLKDEVSCKSQRIYVSRGNSYWRKVVNDDDVAHFLADFGFIRVKLEEMPVVEQAKLFASAEVIIAPHGAGLANLVFCSPGTKVIELVPPTGVDCKDCAPYFWCMSQQLQLNHEFFICNNSNLSNAEINQRHMLVDLSKLDQLLILNGFKKHFPICDPKNFNISVD